MIYIIWAPPREGKTFYATWLVLRALQKGRKVYTNYPVIHTIKQRPKFYKKKVQVVLSTLKWDKLFAKHNITDSMIVIDEGYIDYSSRDFKAFTKETHTFFATNGHNNNDIYIIAQNPARVDLIIREMANVFIHVRKHSFPWSTNPLWFTVEGYLTQEDFALRHSSPNAVYTRRQLLPSKAVKKAYDTHYYRNGDNDFNYTTWSEYLTCMDSEASDLGSIELPYQKGGVVNLFKRFIRSLQ